MRVEELLAPVSDDQPAGEDLSYDRERQDIEQAFEAAAEGGDAAEGVDWRDTVRMIEDQLGRTKDVWLATYLARAGARMGKLDTVVTGCELLAGLFEQYWDSVHPTIEEYGFQGRRAPCESLTRIGEFIGPFRRTILFEHPRLGRYSGEDLARFASEGPDASGYGLFRAAVQETAPEDLEAVIATLDRMRDAIKRVDSAMMDNADGETGTNFQPTYDVIASIRAALAPYVAGAERAEEADDAPAGGGGSTGSGASSGPGLSGQVQSRDDVIKAIDSICDYYARREPGSPVPVALRRVRGWVTMDFMKILRDIVPNSIDDASTVLLARPEEDENSGY